MCGLCFIYTPNPLIACTFVFKSHMNFELLIDLLKTFFALFLLFCHDMDFTHHIKRSALHENTFTALTRRRSSFFPQFGLYLLIVCIDLIYQSHKRRHLLSI